MSKYEEQIMKILKINSIPFIREKSFKDLKHGLFRFDFYISNLNGKKTIIEVDGEQHFSSIYGRAALLKCQEHDRRKNSYCLSNDIIIYRIPYWEIKNIKNFADIIQEKFLVKTKWHNDNLQVPKKI